MNFSNLIKHLDAQGRAKARQYIKFLMFIRRVPVGRGLIKRLGDLYFYGVRL